MSDTMTTATPAAAAWLAWAARHGVPASASADLPAGLAPCHEVMSSSPGEIPALTSKLGRLLAWLHEQPTADAPGAVLTPEVALSRLDHEIVDAPDEVDVVQLGELQRALARCQPGPVSPVPCHGDFTPVTVHLDRADHHQVMLTSWSGAVLADREYDLSFSVLGLWASAYLTPDEEVRTMLRLARSFLGSGFLAGYRASGRQPDPVRMSWWGGYHACRLLAAPLLSMPPFRDWPVDVAAPIVDAFRSDLAQRFAHLTETVIPDTQAGDPR